MTKKTTRDQWLMAASELTDTAHEAPNRTQAQKLFEELATGLGATWTIAEDGSVVIDEPTQPEPNLVTTAVITETGELTIAEVEEPVVFEGVYGGYCPTPDGGDDATEEQTTEEQTPPPAPPAPAPDRILGTHVIRMMVAENPKRPGSASHSRFALYRDGMTVSEFTAAGGKRVDVRWDVDHGFIALA